MRVCDWFGQVAKLYGCGNKWGLFASHIPHRVGYQCSATYRNIIIPRVRARAPPPPPPGRPVCAAHRLCGAEEGLKEPVHMGA